MQNPFAFLLGVGIILTVFTCICKYFAYYPLKAGHDRTARSDWFPKSRS